MPRRTFKHYGAKDRVAEQRQTVHNALVVVYEMEIIAGTRKRSR